MTYITRRTRIIVSRWTDECDADYILRAVRKRSDGRFKRYSSCDDLRAWVNDYCIKHEHLVDLMSDGEFSEQPPFRLYGRFIPVPILFQLMQNLQSIDTIGSGHIMESERQARKGPLNKSATDKCTCIDSTEFCGKNEKANIERSASLSRIEWEKNHLEKNLYESTSLLSRALRTLEKIDNIVDLAKEETENARNEEIQFAFYESQAVCECSQLGEGKESIVSDSFQYSKSCVKRIEDSTKCTELLRKISQLRENLNKVEECRQSIKKQIHISRVKMAKCESSNQVTELFSFRDQSQVKKMKKLEKLTLEKGRLLSEICDALNCLNVLKQSSRLSLPRRRRSRASRSVGVFKCGLGGSPSCACGCNCSKPSSEFDKYNSDSHSGESYPNECNSKQMSPCFTYSPGEFSTRNKVSSRKSRSSDAVRGGECVTSPCFDQEYKKTSSLSQRHTADSSLSNHHYLTPERSISRQEKNTKKTKEQSSPHNRKKEAKESKRHSRVSFADEDESPCRKKFYQDDLSAYEKSITSQQQAVIQGALKKIECRRSHLFDTRKDQKRPTSSPTTRRERDSISAERLRNNGRERRVKSETTMQEIEKTLRNYEQRLQNYEALEGKVEEMRQKISEANRLKREWAKRKEVGQKEIEAEREKSGKEITKLCSENKMLKKQVQQLMTQFEIQCKKIQSLKITAQKNWDLQCEADELKKELLKYQDTFDHQQKCITKWKSMVALQRTEIEKLMSQIRRLTAANNYSAECRLPERKNIQRSRSYSPEMLRPTRFIKVPQPFKRGNRSSSDEEDEEPCYCDEYQELEDMRRNQQEIFSNCYSPLASTLNW